MLKSERKARSIIRRIAELELEVKRRKNHLKAEPSYEAALVVQHVVDERAQLLDDVRATWRLVVNPIGMFL